MQPPTENYSLTFRLTRNCGWNRCIFCPVYKMGVRFSGRAMDEVKRDVDRAKRINEVLSGMAMDDDCFPSGQYKNADELVAAIKDAHPGHDASLLSSLEEIDNGEVRERVYDDEGWPGSRHGSGKSRPLKTASTTYLLGKSTAGIHVFSATQTRCSYLLIFSLRPWITSGSTFLL